jgi:hypothetical protein
MIAAIAVALQKRPPSAPDVKDWVSDYKLIGNPSFVKAMTAVSSVIFAYAGTPGQSNQIPRICRVAKTVQFPIAYYRCLTYHYHH